MRGLARPNAKAQLFNLARRNATNRKPTSRAFPLLPVTAPVTSASKAGTKHVAESNK